LSYLFGQELIHKQQNKAYQYEIRLCLQLNWRC